MVETSTFTHDYSKVRDVLKPLGAEHGKVCTRFPPEPSGYLHIGHVKAAMLNYHYAKMYNGQMILRFDDTNPQNEKLEFQENIMRDLKVLEIFPDRITFSSDYFEQIQGYCRKLIQDNNAYADNTPAEQMSIERGEGIESKNRLNTVARNLEIFEKMCLGDKEYTTWCIRAKMNMQDPVKCLRDPVFYRCKDVPHHRTGDKYKAYPTYDLTVPIVDSLEGVTHSLRTIEYRDRNALYVWVQKVLEIRPCQMYDFSKLNLVSTVLSKRKLKWFVEENIVDGWDDPRFPTVQGIMRKGMTVNALKDFMLDQGPSRNTTLMEWDKLWAVNKDLIDPVCPRYTAINKATACKLQLTGAPELEIKTVPLHPKNESVGVKPVVHTQNVYVEADDCRDIQVGDKVTLMNWGNVIIEKIESIADGNFNLFGKMDLADLDFKKTKKLSWLTAEPEHLQEITLVELGHLITVPKVEEGVDITTIVNPNSKIAYQAYAEKSIKNCQQGTIFQFMRRGYFIIDKIALQNQAMTCHMIPDGKTKSMSTISSKIDAKEMNKGKGEVKDSGKQKAEKKFDDAGNEILSKKDLAKLAKKEKIAGIKAGTDVPAEKGARPAQAVTTQMIIPKQPVVFAAGNHCDALESLLGEKAWMNGSAPSQDDVMALAAVGQVCPNPKQHPNLYGWFCATGRIMPFIRESWPHGAGLPDSCTSVKAQTPAKVAAVQPQQEKKEKKEKAPKPAKEEKKEAAPSLEEAWDVFANCDLRVAKIVECKRHADSDKLYVEQIDLGEGRLRTIGSGLQKNVTLEEMTEGLCMVFANLKPRKLADLMSEGMVLCAANEDHSVCEVMRPPAGAVVGERVQLEGNPCGGAALPKEMAKVLAPKKKFMERCLDKLMVNAKSEGSYNGVRLMTSKGPIICKSLTNMGIS